MAVGALLRTAIRPKAPRTLLRRPNSGVSPFFVVTGLDALSDELTGKSEKVQKEAVKATDKHAEAMWDAFYQSVPVGPSGRTRDSIRNELTVRSAGGLDPEDGSYARWVGSTWFVSRFLVFGTVKMGRKWDMFGVAQPHIDSWMAEMEKLGAKI
jgi:hypothetical protein